MTAGFAPLPEPDTAGGDPRRVGVEIEFAGLTEYDTARLITDHLGGRIAERGTHAITLTGTQLGQVEIVLDTRLRKLADNRIVEAGLNAARGIVPVEIVTEPLGMGGLARLDSLRHTLCRAGASGTEDGLLLGFGVHLNVEVVTPDHPHTRRTILAFALIERWLRTAMEIDVTRRLMPFVDPWPPAFAQALISAAPSPAWDVIRDAYARHCNSRNFALDLLPLFAHADADEFSKLFPNQTNTKARPAFHYRLPDSRIDDPGWTLAEEWGRWCLVERLAAEPKILKQMAANCSTPDDRDWQGEVSRVMDGISDNTAKSCKS